MESGARKFDFLLSSVELASVTTVWKLELKIALESVVGSTLGKLDDVEIVDLEVDEILGNRDFRVSAICQIEFVIELDESDKNFAPPLNYDSYYCGECWWDELEFEISETDDTGSEGSR